MVKYGSNPGTLHSVSEIQIIKGLTLTHLMYSIYIYISCRYTPSFGFCLLVALALAALYRRSTGGAWLTLLAITTLYSETHSVQHRPPFFKMVPKQICFLQAPSTEGAGCKTRLEYRTP